MNPLSPSPGAGQAQAALPRFQDIQPEHIGPAIDAVLATSEAVLQRLRTDATEPTWDTFVRPLEDAVEALARTWGVVAHLNGVVNTPELRDAYNAALPRVTRFWASLGQDEALFARYRALADSAAFASLSPAQQRVVENELRDFRLGGAELDGAAKARYLAIQERLSALSARFEANLIDTTRAWSHTVTDAAHVQGLPADVVEAAAAAAQAEGETGWRFTLHAPSYLPVMQHAAWRPLREALYRGYGTRASEFGPAEWNNGPLIDEILALRAEQASLLGYGSYAEVSLVAKMADTPAQVCAFLRDLARRARPYAEQDMVALRAFAAAELGLADLQPWDVAYASERLREARYAYSDQEVRQYLPERQVLAGLFGLIERLYKVRVVPGQAEVWHPDVRYYTLQDAAATTIGAFYIDLYARDGKRGGAWMDDAITRRELPGGITQTPVAYLTCNFSPPVGGRPATFTHDEVITLFHEFGHGLHHLLSRVGHYSVSGIHGVEWDAVELPSQFMENFCWEWEVLSGMTRHVETGAALPRDLFDRMVAARNFQSGMQTVRQIEFSLFDMQLYDGAPRAGADVLALVDAIRAEVAVVQPPAWHRFPMSFSHIFAGGYAAGYYSYKWAEVLSADAYAAFEEQGVLDSPAGQRFLEEILAVGGSRPALDSFRAFRGRAPTVDALLRHHGMSGDLAGTAA